MNQNHLDVLTHTLGSIPSRRDVLRGLAGVGLGLGAVRFPDLAAAKKKRKRKHKNKNKKKGEKATPNEFGCFEVSDPCTSEADCCSGICEGKKCRAHDTGTCDQTGPEICHINPPLALTCNNDATCRCFGTTAGSIVCSRYEPGSCADCRADADCEALGFPPGSACAPFIVGPCAGECESGMACVIPCGVEFPPVE